MLIVLLIFRRFGLALRAFVFMYFLLALMDKNETDFGKQIAVALGAAIVAFFIPGVKVGSQRPEHRP